MNFWLTVRDKWLQYLNSIHCDPILFLLQFFDKNTLDPKHFFQLYFLSQQLVQILIQLLH